MPSFPEGAAQKGAAASIATHRELCRQADAVIAPIIVALRGQGMSLRVIAAELTRRHFKTRQGWRRWHARQVARILERATGREGTALEAPLPPPETPAEDGIQGMPDAYPFTSRG